MTTEQYSIGYDEGYQAGWNAAMDAKPAQQEPVAYITPLMEQQMFDDWCPYKGNPDPRVVWAGAVEAVNGLLLGAIPPQRPWVGLTDEEQSLLWEISRAALPRYATFYRLIEAKLKEKNT